MCSQGDASVFLNLVQTGQAREILPGSGCCLPARREFIAGSLAAEHQGDTAGLGRSGAETSVTHQGRLQKLGPQRVTIQGTISENVEG